MAVRARINYISTVLIRGLAALGDKSSDLSDSHKKSHVKHSEKTVTQISSHSNRHGP